MHVCPICNGNAAKYKDKRTNLAYCSVQCYKKIGELHPEKPLIPRDPVVRPTRRLADLAVPPEPDASLFDASNRDAIKPLRQAQYHAIARDPRMRRVLRDPEMLAVLSRIAALDSESKRKDAIRALLDFPPPIDLTYKGSAPQQRPRRFVRALDPHMDIDDDSKQLLSVFADVLFSLLDDKS